MNDSRGSAQHVYTAKRMDNGTFIEFLLLEQKGGQAVGDHLPAGEKGAKVRREVFLWQRQTAGKRWWRSSPDGNRVVQFTCEGNFYTALEEVGQMPLPPYIHEKLKDNERYQTVYSKELGSAAAPTAGLHFYKRNAAKASGQGYQTGICDTACRARHISSGKRR